MQTIYRPKTIIVVERGWQKIIARAMGVSRQYVCQSLRRKRNGRLAVEIRRFALTCADGREERTFS